MHNEVGNSSEYFLLKTLLSTWNLENLVDYFIDEDITVDVLRMLKPHHIPVLLRNYKFGVQVRFEHYLEIWRRDINKPLSSHAYSSDIHYSNVYNQDRRELPSTLLQRSVSTQFSPHDLFPEPTEKPTPSNSPASSPSSVIADIRTPPKLTPAPVNTTTTSKLDAILVEPTTSTSAAITSNTSQQRSERKKSALHSFSPIDSHRLPLIRAGAILQGHPKGLQILRYYEDHQTLTTAHRLMLVNLIATFFDDHNYHLSLQTSYNMERDILELFPTEQLEYYRTEKRGKIYVKFCNMKRYKVTRDKTAKRKKRDNSADFSSSLENVGVSAVDAMPSIVDDDFSMNFDNWSAETTHPLEGFVKTENLNEEDYA